ncbi:MAG: hypothetical protein U5M23_08685 [Marinagarivorans sp.]|nr:hypothetical protein [Marinagarivorans sp.]
MFAERKQWLMENFTARWMHHGVLMANPASRSAARCGALITTSTANLGLARCSKPADRRGINDHPALWQSIAEAGVVSFWRAANAQ